jgi:hypothetical protein
MVEGVCLCDDGGKEHFSVLACRFLYPLASASADVCGDHSAAAAVARWRALIHKTKVHICLPTLCSALGGHPTLPAVQDMLDIAGLANCKNAYSAGLHVHVEI